MTTSLMIYTLDCNVYQPFVIQITIYKNQLGSEKTCLYFTLLIN